MSGLGEGMKRQDDGTLEAEEWGTGGGEFLRGLRELASECASVIEWNEELVQKNKELTAQLETLRSRYEHLSGEILQAVSTEITTLLREFEQRARTAVREIVEGVLQRDNR